MGPRAPDRTDGTQTGKEPQRRGMRLGWIVDRVTLFRRHTDPGGSRYEELASAALHLED